MAGERAMTGTDVAFRDRPASVALSTDQLQYIAHTEFVPPGLRGNLPAILACVATGREIGIGDMVALKSIHIIDGKATYSAELMVMLARRAGHSITGKVSEGTAKVVGRRADNGDQIEVEWTLAMADRAGLLGKSNWKKYPEAMLWARAVSQLCRELFADCFAGSTYTTEELGDELTDEHGGAVEAPASPLEDPPVDMSDPDIPFGDAAFPEHQPPMIYASDKQRRLMFAKAKEAGLDTPALKAIIKEHTGQESSAAIPREKFEAILSAIDERLAVGSPTGEQT